MASIKNNQKGFSLIELIVAVGVFAVVATIATGALLGLSTAQKKAIYIQTNQDNVRFALETMSREIRTGVCYKGSSSPDDSLVCPGYNPPIPSNQCSSNSQCIQFLNSRGQVVVYKRSGYRDECGIDNTHVIDPTIRCIAKQLNLGRFYPVTAREVVIQALEFRIFGENSTETNNVQPRVTILLRAQTPGASTINTQLEAQTTISQLYLDETL